MNESRKYAVSQVEQASHPCAACGGSGERIDYTPTGFETGTLAGADYIGIRRCHVCLGAGRLSDRMPARNAVADGETAWVLLQMFGWNEVTEAMLSLLVNKHEDKMALVARQLAHACLLAFPELRA